MFNTPLDYVFRFRDSYPRVFHYGGLTTALLILFSKPIYDVINGLFFAPRPSEERLEYERQMLYERKMRRSLWNMVFGEDDENKEKE